MSTHPLFADEKTFTVDWLPAPFKGVQHSDSLRVRFGNDDYSDTMIRSMIKNLTPKSPYIICSGFSILMLMLETFNGSEELKKIDPDHRYSLLRVSDTDELAWYVCEYDDPDGSSVIVEYNLNKTTWVSKLRGVRVTQVGDTISYSSLGALKGKEYPYPMTAVYLPIYHAMLSVGNQTLIHMQDCATKTLKDIYLQNQHLDNSKMEALAAFSHTFYALVDETAVVTDSQVKRLPVKFSAGNINVIPQRDLNSGIYGDATVMFGEARFFNPNGTSHKPAKAAKPTIGSMKERYKDFREQRQWTQEEQELIPVFQDNMPVPEEVEILCRAIVCSSGMTNPIRNLMWRGGTGYGKTTGCKMVACILGVPLLRQTCYPSMETQDFLSAFVPDNGPAFDGGIPTVEDMYLDPASAYEQMTGIEKDDATAQDCLDEVYKRAARTNGTARFKHVEANYVKALAHGYMVELSEVSRIREPGVLVGLDDFDLPGAVIPLVNGGHVRRHKDAIVLMTDNVGYVSCRPVDPAVLRRMAFILDSDTMPKSKVIARIKQNTGFKDSALLNIMYKTWSAVADYCSKHEINEGSVSIVELERWVQMVMIDGPDSVYDNCIRCVVNKATNVREEQDEIKSAVLDLNLSGMGLN